jgi:hypothetical protein
MMAHPLPSAHHNKTEGEPDDILVSSPQSGGLRLSISFAAGVDMSSGKSGRPGENDVPIGFRLVEGVKGDIPTERYGHSAVVHAGLMIVFGGCDNRGSFSAQTFIFDLGNLSPPSPNK